MCRLKNIFIIKENSIAQFSSRDLFLVIFGKGLKVNLRTEFATYFFTQMQVIFYLYFVPSSSKPKCFFFQCILSLISNIKSLVHALAEKEYLEIARSEKILIITTYRNKMHETNWPHQWHIYPRPVFPTLDPISLTFLILTLSQ